MDFKKVIFLSKVDLITNVVREYPDLHCLAASQYLKASNVDNKVISIIKEQSQDSKIKLKESSILAMIDKIDDLLTIFSNTKAPTGSRDPLGVRFDCNLIIKEVIESKYNFDLFVFFQELISIYPNLNLSLLKSIEAFFNKRIYFIKEVEIKDALALNGNILERYLKYEIILKKKACFYRLLSTFKRVKNILGNKKSNNISFINNTFSLSVDLEIYKHIKTLEEDNNSINILKYLLKENFLNSIEKYFNEVKILENKDRLLMLNNLYIITSKVINFNRML